MFSSFYLGCWIRDSSNKRTYISSFLSFFWLIPSNMDGFQRLPKNMLRFSKGHLFAIISSGNILWKTCTMSVQHMKEKWLFTMFNVKIISTLLWHLLLPQTPPIIFCRLDTGWFHLIINPPRQFQIAFLYVQCLLTKCDF